MTTALQRLIRNRSADVVIEISSTAVETLHRRFDSEAHAQAFLEGHIFVSSLGRCRATEDKVRGDEGEGTHVHEIAYALPGTPFYEQKLRLIGMDPKIYKNTVVGHTRHRIGIRDAWVLCMSKSFDGEGRGGFGSHVVTIRQPLEFFAEMTLQMFHWNLATQALVGPIIYGDRFTDGVSLQFGPEPFVKPQKFADEDEFRFCWCHDDPIDMHPAVMQFKGVRRFLSM